MNYLLAASVLAMMGYMLGLTTFRMRRDRVLSHREATRGTFAFRPRERVRLMLDRAFRPAADKPPWEDPLISHLSKIGAESRDREFISRP